MAPIALRLLSVTDVPQFLTALRASDVKPLTVNRVVRWVVVPTTSSLVSSVLDKDTKWDLLLVLPTNDLLPTELTKLVKKEWYVTAGMPSSLLKGFEEKNKRLLHPAPGDVPKLKRQETGHGMKESAQNLELSEELAAWVQEFSKKEGAGAVSMFNLLSFKPGNKASYLKYGKAFAEDIGKSRGGVAKIVGKVIEVSSSPKSGGEKGDNGLEFDEIAVAHYPSILHFANMLEGDDYQNVNHKFRVPALRDTFILCTTELGLPDVQREGAKL